MASTLITIQGIVEKISDEGQFHAPVGCVWVKVTGHDPVLADVNFLSQIQKGAEVQLQLTRSGHHNGLLVEDVQVIKELSDACTTETRETISVGNETVSEAPKAQAAVTVANPNNILSPAFSIRLEPKDPELKAFMPHEQPSGSGLRSNAIAAAGALSAMMIGVGWKTKRLPTRIISLQRCEIEYCLFASDNRTRGQFLFGLGSLLNLKAVLSRTLYGMKIFGKGGQLDLSSYGNSEEATPGLLKLRSDRQLQSNFQWLLASGLVHDNLIIVNYEKTHTDLVGMVVLDLEFGHKAWTSVVARGVDPNVFVVTLFNSLRSLVRYVREDFGVRQI